MLPFPKQGASREREAAQEELGWEMGLLQPALGSQGDTGAVMLCGQGL